MKTNNFLLKFSLLVFVLTLFSCEPKCPKNYRLYSSEDLEHHPKDANGVPDGYVPVYSRTGINSVDYAKIKDVERYDKEMQEYEEYQKEKVLKEEYGR